MTQATFEEMLALAQSQSLSGWDFSWLNARTTEEPLPWDYRALVKERMAGAASLLDVGTGGGEFLAGLAPHPPLTWATEGYPPNVILARQRLEPLGIQVADTSQTDGILPFEDETFELVIDRHEGVLPGEVARVLKPGGRYITQQVGGQNAMELNRLLQDEPYFEYANITLRGDVEQLEAAGLSILQAREYMPDWTFYDLAGVVFYLTAVPWQIADFSVERYREKLLALHRQIERDGKLVIKEHRYLIEAVKPG